MITTREFYSKTGSGACIVKEGKILETYLLGEEDLRNIEKISSLVSNFPKDFDAGIIEFGEKSRFGIFKVEDHFLIFPVRTENVAEIIRRREIIDAG
ncbi:MAG: hypothetical protein N3D09_02675 [Archaeoglobaceae archaeon]|nr:hypothetical protein [Archaeoglobaceae archaeon]